LLIKLKTYIELKENIS